MMRCFSGNSRQQLGYRRSPIRAGAICAVACQSLALLLFSFYFCLEAQAYTATAQTREVSTESNTIGYAWDEFQNPFAPDFDSANLVVPATPNVDASSASDFDAFVAAASTVSPGLVFLSATTGTASADQDSTLGATLIEASGSIGLAGDSYLMTVGDLSTVTLFFGPPTYTFGNVGDVHDGRSSFSVTFDVSEPTAYSLTGVVALTTAMEILPGGEIASGFIELATSGGATIAKTDFACFFCDPLPSEVIDAAGILPPGSYTISAEIVGEVTGLCIDLGTLTCLEPELNGSFSLNLTLEPPMVPALGGVGTWGLVVGLMAAGVGLRSRMRK